MNNIFFKQMELNNWISFNGYQPITFSTDQKKNVTLIRADNEVGKTSLLKGILWCFYGDSKVEFSQRLKTHGQRLNHLAADEGDGSYGVKLIIEAEGKTLTLERLAKLKAGKDIRSDDYDETINFIVDGETYSDSSAQIEINKIIDPSISRFYLFDGEMLSQYKKLVEADDSTIAEHIEKSIEDVLRITHLRNAKKSLDSIKESALRAFNKDETNSENAKNTTAKIEILTKEKNKLLEDFEAVHKDVVELDEQISEAETKLANSKGEVALVENIETSKSKILDLNNTQDDLEIKLSEIIRDVHLDLLSPTIQNILSTKETLRNKILKKIEASNKFEILEGLILNESISSESKDIIKQLLPKSNPANTDNLKDEIFELEADIKKFKNYQVKSIEADVLRAYDKLSTCRFSLFQEESKLKNLKLKLNDINNFSNEEIAALKNLPETIRKLSEKVGKKNVELEVDKEGTIAHKLAAKEKDIRILEEIALPDSNTESEAMMKLSKSLFNIFDNSIKDLAFYSKQRVQNIANDLYVNFRANRVLDDEDQNVLKITDTYGLNIVMDGGDGEETDTSEGGAQIVALCLILALRQAIGLQGPLFMDTPMGRLDSRYRDALINHLPSLGTQLILFVQPGEIEEFSELDKATKPLVGSKYELLKETNKVSRAIKK
jgi:DNA sulfur modification protein DndD